MQHSKRGTLRLLVFRYKGKHSENDKENKNFRPFSDCKLWEFQLPVETQSQWCSFHNTVKFSLHILRLHIFLHLTYQQRESPLSYRDKHPGPAGSVGPTTTPMEGLQMPAQTQSLSSIQVCTYICSLFPSSCLLY